MSGPYPPPGQPRPPERGWWGGQPGPNQGGPYGTGQPPHFRAPQPPLGQYGTPFGQQPHDIADDFPTVRYSGLAGQTGWGAPQPPRKRRSTGRIVVAIVSVLVIIGGVATGIVLLNQRHNQPQATPSIGQHVSSPTTTQRQNPAAATTAPAGASQPDSGVPAGSAPLVLTVGSCVAAQVTGGQTYTATQQVACGSAQSDLVLAQTSPDVAGCADRQYLRLTAPNAGYYCFTLDVKQGDCVDNSYLKTPCTSAPYQVLSTEAGPGSTNSCSAATGATHWVPVGRDPVKVGCLGPPKTP